MFLHREHAGEMLAERLNNYKNREVVVYAIPRGGVAVARPIAKKLGAPLELLITRKIGHPNNLEYAIAAVSESGFIVGDPQELGSVDSQWLKREIKKERKESIRRRNYYRQGETIASSHYHIAIIVDDGIATGWTLKAALREIKQQKPSKIIIAVPVIPRSLYDELHAEKEHIVALEIPSSDTFLGAIGMYYEDFTQMSDEEVKDILTEHDTWLASHKKDTIFWKPRVEYEIG